MRMNEDEDVSRISGRRARLRSCATSSLRWRVLVEPASRYATAHVSHVGPRFVRRERTRAGPTARDTHLFRNMFLSVAGRRSHFTVPTDRSHPHETVRPVHTIFAQPRYIAAWLTVHIVTKPRMHIVPLSGGVLAERAAVCATVCAQIIEMLDSLKTPFTANQSSRDRRPGRLVEP